MHVPDEAQSEYMVRAFYADPDGYFEVHARDGFLPPLAPAVMERLRQGIGLGIELLYYQKTKAYRAEESANPKSPHIVTHDEQGEIYSFRKASKIANKDDLPF